MGQGLFCVLGMSKTSFSPMWGLLVGCIMVLFICAIPYSRVYGLPGTPVTVTTKNALSQFQILHCPAPQLGITGLNHILVYYFPVRLDIKCWTFRSGLFSSPPPPLHFVVDGYT